MPSNRLVSGRSRRRKIPLPVRGAGVIRLCDGAASRFVVKPILLRLASNPVGGRPYVLNINVAFMVQVAEQLAERVIDFTYVLRLFCLTIGFIRNLDVKVEAAFGLF